MLQGLLTENASTLAVLLHAVGAFGMSYYFGVGMARRTGSVLMLWMATSLFTLYSPSSKVIWTFRMTLRT